MINIKNVLPPTLIIGLFLKKSRELRKLVVVLNLFVVTIGFTILCFKRED